FYMISRANQAANPGKALPGPSQSAPASASAKSARWWRAGGVLDGQIGVQLFELALVGFAQMVAPIARTALAHGERRKLPGRLNERIGPREQAEVIGNST